MIKAHSEESTLIGEAASPLTGRWLIGPFKRLRAIVEQHPTAVFWTTFVGLNLLLFLPLMILRFDELWPLAMQSGGGETATLQERLWRLAQRESPDPFRLNLELLLLITLWTSIKWLQRPLFRLLLTVVYFATLAYALYEGITLSLWQAEPVFYTHYYLAKDGIDFLLTNLHLPLAIYLLVIGGLALAIALVWATLRTMTAAASSQHLGITTRIILLILTVTALGLVGSMRSTLASPAMTVSSLTAKLERNLERSMEVYARVNADDDQLIRTTHDYSGYQLAETPDIYLIFVESYGSVLYKRDDYRVMYEALLEELEAELSAGGWHAATTLSEAPTWGGGSWMSYTSALFGMRIEEHPDYLALVDHYQETPYPDLGNYLKSQGYRYVRVSALSKQLSDASWQRYKRFFGVDDWLRYGDLGYVGQRYGWGPAPPDQYVLNFARQSADHASDDPRLLFYITQNSHYPWMPLPSVADDWRSLNVPEADKDAVPDDDLPHAERRQNYFNAIDYELRFLTDYILENEDDNAIFVLIGDHQPPRVSRRADGWDTPMHIISKDAAFVDSFAAYGLVPGLTVDTIEPTTRHEAFYTMMIRQLLANYGVDPTRLPPHLPNGVIGLTAAGETE